MINTKALMIGLLFLLPMASYAQSARFGPKAKNTPAWKKDNLTTAVMSNSSVVDLKGPLFKNERSEMIALKRSALLPVLSKQHLRATGPQFKNVMNSPRRFNHEIRPIPTYTPIEIEMPKEQSSPDPVISEPSRDL